MGLLSTISEIICTGNKRSRREVEKRLLFPGFRVPDPRGPAPWTCPQDPAPWTLPLKLPPGPAPGPAPWTHPLDPPLHQLCESASRGRCDQCASFYIDPARMRSDIQVKVTLDASSVAFVPLFGLVDGCSADKAHF